MRHLAVVLFALLFALPSCAAIPRAPKVPNVGRIKVVIDRDFGPYGIEMAIKGINMWHESAGVCFDISVEDVSTDNYTWADDEVSTIYFARDGWRAYVFEKLAGDRPVAGMTLFPMRDIFLPSNINKMRQLVAHEMGHVLGIMEHSENRMSIMYYLAWGGPQSILYEDAKMVADLLPNHRCR